MPKNTKFAGSDLFQAGWSSVKKPGESDYGTR